jgi:hypothetical protein
MALSPRYEVKAIGDERSHAVVMAALRMHEAALRNAYPARIVQSIYFDDHEGTALDDNLAGVSDRSKIRLRWYGEASICVAATLERKLRSNHVGTKETLRLAEPIDIDGTSRVALVGALRRQTPAAWRELLDAAPEPAQWIRYSREYLTTADGTVRVTVDSDLRAWDLRDRWRIRPVWRTPLPRVTIVEFKALVEHRRGIERLLQGLPVVVDKCSKFELATAPRHAPLIPQLP